MSSDSFSLFRKPGFVTTDEAMCAMDLLQAFEDMDEARLKKCIASQVEKRRRGAREMERAGEREEEADAEVEAEAEAEAGEDERKYGHLPHLLYSRHSSSSILLLLV